MRITLDEIIRRHKKANPNTDYDYSQTVLGNTLHDKVTIICPQHGLFQQGPHEHMKGQGCPYCAQIQRTKSLRSDVEDFITRSKDKFGNRFSYNETRLDYTKIKDECSFYCNIHRIVFRQKPAYHLRKENGGCPLCAESMRSKDGLTKQERNEIKLQKQQERKQRKEKREESNEALRHQKVQAKIDKQKQKAVKEQEKIAKLKAVGEDKKKLFIQKCISLYGERYDLSEIKRMESFNGSKVPVICHKIEDGQEHGLFWKNKSDFLRGRGCPKCSTRHNWTTHSLIKAFVKVHGGRYNYSEVVFTKMINEVRIKCNVCNRWFNQVAITHINGHGCPYCNRSLAEITVEQALSKGDIVFQTQQRFEWLGMQSFDFFIPFKNIAIECQGEQHFVPRDKFGGVKGYQQTAERDIRKARLAKENNITLIYFLEPRLAKYMKDSSHNWFTSTEDLLAYIRNLPTVNIDQ